MMWNQSAFLTSLPPKHCDFEFQMFDPVPSPPIHTAYPRFEPPHWLKRGQLVRWKRCVGRICRVVKAWHGCAHVQFFWPTTWANDVSIEDLEPIDILDVLANVAT